ncbi:helix-turn-helix domain-containing protein [Streptomyces gibsoniae]|uniref:AraC family transcriptional regulator n=1 Tax=Streptomyces gibsoniae TaxID=3075529 RepID=A0ABU2UAY3_9ACTN|nr:AraC family transcriptional regulator [Streptomyces sp. DSM 41699]MDT0470127.1 AraC family transcriptional regulator [Streptomyces sp. DSM 41699]
MGKIGQDSIVDLPYRPSLGAPIGMDVLPFTELRDRVRRRGIELGAPIRPSFHRLVHVRAGTLEHTVDFTHHSLDAGEWLWVRAGQVLQHSAEGLAQAQGTLILWQPGFLPTEPPLDVSPLRPEGPHARAVNLALRHLMSQYDDLGSLPLEAHVDVLRHLLAVLLLRLSGVRRPAMPTTAGRDAFHRFQAAVERDFTRSHRVADYATDLGYSVRTLTRACVEATGQTAKQYLDARVLLEAKRLLVHTDASSMTIGAQLGFPEATDFTKFFRRRDGRTPVQFRTQARGTELY